MAIYNFSGLTFVIKRLSVVKIGYNLS